MGPVIVAVQKRRFSGEDGNADIDGVGCIIRVMSSVWRLQVLREWGCLRVHAGLPMGPLQEKSHTVS